jgi:M6 family metalloprotease-like protein
MKSRDTVAANRHPTKPETLRRSRRAERTGIRRAIVLAGAVTLAVASGHGRAEGDPSAITNASPTPRTYRNGTSFLNEHCGPWPGCGASASSSTGVLEVLCLLVDTEGLRWSGSDGDLATYRNDLAAELENTNSYWLETSFGNIGVDIELEEDVIPLAGTFDDYFNREFVAASLTSTAIVFPLSLDGSTLATLHVRDGGGRNVDVEIAPPADEYADEIELATALQDIFDEVDDVPADWVTVSSFADKIRFQLADAQTDEGSFIRVRDGDFSNLASIGLFGPLEAPREDGVPANFVGKPVPGGFPVLLDGTESVTIEVRGGEEYPITRRIEIGFTSGSKSRSDILLAIVEAISPEIYPLMSLVLPETPAGSLALGLNATGTGDDSAIRIVDGSGLDKLGLDGPARIDGVITADKTKTVRGYRPGIVEEALEEYVKRLAATSGLDITCGNDADQLDDLLDDTLAEYDSFLILFIDDLDGDGSMDIPSGRRAGASATNTFQLGIGDFTVACQGYRYEYDFNSGLMIGPGNSTWFTWAHELGHTLGFVDLYPQSWHDDSLVDPHDYVENWGLMSSSANDPHVCAWHKLLEPGWIAEDAIGVIDTPPYATTETHLFTLTPLEYPFDEYETTGSDDAPARQVLKIRLSDSHWILIENRQPGVDHSGSLPNDVDGDSQFFTVGSQRGGLFVSDTCEYKSFCGNRPQVITLNPDGSSGVGEANARGIAPGETFDLSQATPLGYDGIIIRDLGEVAGPSGSPPARLVEVEWGPGDFVELEIRPWEAPETYGTHDIWVDFPGNGEETYDNDPPLETGDAPRVGAKNLLKVRVWNRGTVDATGVEVEGAVNTPGGMGDDGEFVKFPDTIFHDIPAGGYADYEFEWTPEVDSHTCVRARIVSHDSPFADVDSGNNESQENIWTFVAEASGDGKALGLVDPGASSGYDAIEFDMKIDSDSDYREDVILTVSPLPPGFRFVVDPVQIRLRPHETRTVRGRILVDIDVIPPDANSQKLRFSVHALRETPDAYTPWGGGTIQVQVGRRSQIEFRGVDCDPDEAHWTVIHGALIGPLPGFQQITGAIRNAEGKEFQSSTMTKADGTFEMIFFGAPQGDYDLRLWYHGPTMAWSALGPVAIDTRPELAKPNFELSFSGNCGADLPATGNIVTGHADCILTTRDNPCTAGVSAWSIGVRSDGAIIGGITTSGTAGADSASDAAGLRLDGFEWSEVTTTKGNEGAVSAVILSIPHSVTLPPNGPSKIARITYRVDVDETRGCTPVRLEYVDGLVGSAAAVENLAVYRGTAYRPEFSICEVRYCAATSRWPSYDGNSDARIDLSDAIVHLGELFLGTGPLPCAEAMDFNADGRRDVTDPIAALSYLFLSGPAPALGLGCQSQPSCESAAAC